MQFDQGANGIYSPVPKFRAFALPSGVNRLLPYCTLNSVAKLPMLRYTFKDATLSGLTPWTYGETLAHSGDSFTTLNQGSPCLGYHDDSVQLTTDGEGSGIYYASNNTFGNVGTDDMVIRCLVKFNYLDGFTGTSYIMKKITTVGYELAFSHTDSKIYFYVCDSHGIATIGSAVLELDTWYWVGIYADRSGNCQMYVNGTTSGAAVDISGNAATMDSATYLIFGGGSLNLAYVDMCHGAAWLDTATQTDPAWNDFCRVTGVYPDLLGTDDVDTTDASPTADRAYSGYLEKYNPTTGKLELYYVGADWMRVCSKENTVSGGVARGFLSEKESENVIIESEDFSATWGLLGA